MLQPTIVSGVAPRIKFIDQEIFTPVLSIWPFDQLGEVIEGINATPFGTNFLKQNENPTSLGRAVQATLLRPMIGYDSIKYTQFTGNSSYHSLQTQITRRFGQHLNVYAAWTWSSSMNYQDFDGDNRSALLRSRRR